MDNVNDLEPDKVCILGDQENATPLKAPDSDCSLPPEDSDSPECVSMQTSSIATNIKESETAFQDAACSSSSPDESDKNIDNDALSSPVKAPDSDRSSEYSDFSSDSAHSASDSDSSSDSDSDSDSIRSSCKATDIGETSQGLKETDCSASNPSESDNNIDNDVADVPSRDAALSIDHILDQIFSLLPSSDLLNCRLMSRRWNSFATTGLLKQEFELKFDIMNPGRFIEFETFLREHFSEGILYPCPFPCSKFHISNDYAEPDDFIFFADMMELTHELFALHGVHIKKLSLKFRSVCDSGDDLSDERDDMEEIEKLLCTSAPNISHLVLDVASRITWKQDREAPTESNAYFVPLLTSDPEFEEIHSKYKAESGFSSKLSVLELSHRTSAKAVEMIIQLAPKLKEVIAPRHFHLCLLQPLNRLHLLKRLYFFPDAKWKHLGSLMKPFEEIAAASDSGVLKLREININTPQYSYESQSPPSEFELKLMKVMHEFKTPDKTRQRIVNMINRILKGSWDTLETFAWCRMTYLNEIEFPPVMPKVRKIHLAGPSNLDGFGNEFFSALYSWSETFPNLQSFSLYDVSCWHSFMDFLNCLNIFGLETVKEVVVLVFKRVRKGEKRELKMMFPNAELKICHWGSKNEGPCITGDVMTCQLLQIIMFGGSALMW